MELSFLHKTAATAILNFERWHTSAFVGRPKWHGHSYHY